MERKKKNDPKAGVDKESVGVLALASEEELYPAL